MKLNGQITISRLAHKNIGDNNAIHIEIIDKTSGVLFVTAKLTLSDFALAVTGLGLIKCTLDINGLDVVGRQRQEKKEFIPLKINANDDELAAAIKPLEVDGWIGLIDNTKNYHKYDRDRGGYIVSFLRYVEV